MVQGSFDLSQFLAAVAIPIDQEEILNSSQAWRPVDMADELQSVARPPDQPPPSSAMLQPARKATLEPGTQLFEGLEPAAPFRPGGPAAQQQQHPLRQQQQPWLPPAQQQQHSMRQLAPHAHPSAAEQQPVQPSALLLGQPAPLQQKQQQHAPEAQAMVQPASPRSQPGGSSLSYVQRNVSALANALFDSPASLAPMPPALVLAPAGMQAGQPSVPILAAEAEAGKGAGAGCAGAATALQQPKEEVPAAVVAAASAPHGEETIDVTAVTAEPANVAAAQAAEGPGVELAGPAGTVQQLGLAALEQLPAAGQQHEGEEQWTDAEEAAGGGSQEEQQVFEDAAEHLPGTAEEPSAAMPPGSQEPVWAGQLLTQAPLSPGDGFVFDTQQLENAPELQPAGEAAAQAPAQGLQGPGAGEQQRQQPSVTGSLQGSVAQQEGTARGEAVTSRSPVQLPFRLLTGWGWTQNLARRSKQGTHGKDGMPAPLTQALTQPTGRLPLAQQQQQQQQPAHRPLAAAAAAGPGKGARAGAVGPQPGTRQMAAEELPPSARAWNYKPAAAGRAAMPQPVRRSPPSAPAAQPAPVAVQPEAVVPQEQTGQLSPTLQVGQAGVQDAKEPQAPAPQPQRSTPTDPEGAAAVTQAGATGDTPKARNAVKAAGAAAAAASPGSPDLPAGEPAATPRAARPSGAASPTASTVAAAAAAQLAQQRMSAVGGFLGILAKISPLPSPRGASPVADAAAKPRRGAAAPRQAGPVPHQPTAAAIAAADAAGMHPSADQALQCTGSEVAGDPAGDVVHGSTLVDQETRTQLAAAYDAAAGAREAEEEGVAAGDEVQVAPTAPEVARADSDADQEMQTEDAAADAGCGAPTVCSSEEAEPGQRQLSSPLPETELVVAGSDQAGHRHWSSPLPATQVVAVNGSEGGQEATSPEAGRAAPHSKAGGARTAGEAADAEQLGEEKPSAATVPVVIAADEEQQDAVGREPGSTATAAMAASQPGEAFAILELVDEPQLDPMANRAASAQANAEQRDAAEESAAVPPIEEANVLPLHAAAHSAELSPLLGTVLPPPSQFPESQLREQVPPTPAGAQPCSEPLSDEVAEAVEQEALPAAEVWQGEPAEPAVPLGGKPAAPGAATAATAQADDAAPAADEAERQEGQQQQQGQEAEEGAGAVQLEAADAAQRLRRNVHQANVAAAAAALAEQELMMAALLAELGPEQAAEVVGSEAATDFVALAAQHAAVAAGGAAAEEAPMSPAGEGSGPSSFSFNAAPPPTATACGAAAAKPAEQLPVAESSGGSMVVLGSRLAGRKRPAAVAVVSSLLAESSEPDLFELLLSSKRQQGTRDPRQRPLGLSRPSEEEEAEEAAAAVAAKERPRQGADGLAPEHGSALAAQPPASAAMWVEPAVAPAAVPGSAIAVVHAAVQAAAAQVAATGMQTEHREQRPAGVQAGRPQLRLLVSIAAQTAALPATVDAEVQARSRCSGAAQTVPVPVEVAAAMVQTAGVDVGVQHKAHIPRTSAGTQTSVRPGCMDRQLQVHMVPKLKRTTAAGVQAGPSQPHARMSVEPAGAAVQAAAPASPAVAAQAMPAAVEVPVGSVPAKALPRAAAVPAAVVPAGTAAAAATASAAAASSRSTAVGQRRGPVQRVQPHHRPAARHETEGGLVVTEVGKGAHPTRLAPDRAGVAAAQHRQAEAARRRQERECQQEAEQWVQQAEQAAAAQPAVQALGAGVSSHPGAEQQQALAAQPQPVQNQPRAATTAEWPAAAAALRKRTRSAGVEAVQAEAPAQKRLSPVLLAAQKKIREAQLERAAKRMRDAADGVAPVEAPQQAGTVAPQLHRLAGPSPMQGMWQAPRAQQPEYVRPALQAQQEALASRPCYAAAPLMRLPKPAQAAATLEQDEEEEEREGSPQQEYSPWGWRPPCPPPAAAMDHLRSRAGMAAASPHATPLAAAAALHSTPAATAAPTAMRQPPAPQQPEVAAAGAEGTPWQAQQGAAGRPAGPPPFSFPRYTPAGLRPDDPRIRRISDAEIAKLPTTNRRGDPNRNPFLRLRRGGR